MVDRRGLTSRAARIERHVFSVRAIAEQIGRGENFIAHAPLLHARAAPNDDAADVESFTTQEQLDTYIAALESDMREAAKKFEFEKAAQLRDKVRELKTKEFIFTGSEVATAEKTEP